MFKFTKHFFQHIQHSQIGIWKVFLYIGIQKYLPKYSQSRFYKRNTIEALSCQPTIYQKAQLKVLLWKGKKKCNYIQEAVRCHRDSRRKTHVSFPSRKGGLKIQEVHGMLIIFTLCIFTLFSTIYFYTVTMKSVPYVNLNSDGETLRLLVRQRFFDT